MKQLLRGLLALVVILGLTLAAIWLVRGAPPSSRVPFHQVTATSHSSQPTPGETSPPTSQSISANQITATVTLVAQPAPEPTATPTFQPIFESLKVVSVEEINLSPDQSVGTLSDGKSVPVGFSVDWSPDGQKALVARQLTHPHVLSRSSEDSYSPLNAMDLWVWDQKTGQEILVTDKGHYWDWSSDSQAIVYITSVGNEGIDGELYTFDLDTKTGQKVVDTDITQAYPGPFWLSSGEIIYMDEARLWIMQPDGSNRRLLNDLRFYRDEAVDAGRDEYSYASDKVSGRLYLSPDETRIAYTTLSSIEPDLTYQLQLVDLSGNNQVAMEEGSGFRAWSSDSAFFLYQAPNPANYLFDDLWTANKEGTNRQRLLDAIEWGKNINYADLDINRPGMISYVTLSPDNQFIVFSEIDEGGIWLLDIASAKWRLLYQDENLQPFRTLAWPTNDKLIVSVLSSPFRVDQKHFQLRLAN